MSVDERKKKNLDTIDKLERLQNEIEQWTHRQMTHLEANAKDTFPDLRAMIWIAFILGVFLVGLSLILFTFQQRTLDVLGRARSAPPTGLRSFSTSPWTGYKKASADFSQEVLVLRAGVIGPNLELLAMNVNDPQSVIVAAKNINTSCVELAKAIQEFVES